MQKARGSLVDQKEMVSPLDHVSGRGTMDGPEGPRQGRMEAGTDEDGMEEALLEALLEEEYASSRACIQGSTDGAKRRPLKRPVLAQKKLTRQKRKKREDTTVQQEGRLRNGDACDSHAQCSGQDCLTHLPMDCLERIVARLSPNALCNISQTCRLCRSMASSASLWKALYFARWPYGLVENEEEMKKEDWKQMYMYRDAEEMKTITNVTQEDAQLYSQMTLACREQSLTDEDADATLCIESNSMCVPGSLKDQVHRFKKYHGIETRRVDDTRTCSCEYVRLSGKYWICRCCGSVHVCGDMCEERDRCVGDEMIVCRLTGCCFRDMVEEHDEQQPQENGEDGHDVGRLGQAFLAGYHASDRREMLMKFGVSID